MTVGLVLYADGEIREIDLDPQRADVVAATLNAAEIVEIPLDTIEPTVLATDLYATRDVAPVNVLATFLVFAVRRRNSQPFHGIYGGAALLFGLDADDQWTDVPDHLLIFLRALVAMGDAP